MTLSCKRQKTATRQNQRVAIRDLAGVCGEGLLSHYGVAIGVETGWSANARHGELAGQTWQSSDEDCFTRPDVASAAEFDFSGRFCYRPTIL